MIYKFQTSFAAGEIAPNLYARTDWEKYKVGAALLENWFVDFRGGASNRAGTQFLNFVGGQQTPLVFQVGRPRVLPFVVGQQDGYVVELGAGYLRVYQFGVPIYSSFGSITAISQANPAVYTQPAHGFSNGDYVSVSGAAGMLQANIVGIVSNVTANTYELTPVPGTAAQAPFSSAGLPAYTGGGVGSKIMTLATPYTLADLPLVKYSQSADVMTLTHPNYPVQQLTLQNGVWTVTSPTFGAKVNPPSGLAVTSPSTTDPDYCYCYVVTAVSSDGKSESVACSPVLHHYTILDETKGYINSLEWSASPDPVSVYRIFKCGPSDDRVSTGPGSIFGFIGSSQTTTFDDNNIAPDFTQTPPLYGNPYAGGQFESIIVTSGGGGYNSGGSWDGYVPLTITNTGTGVGTGAAGFATTSHSGVVTGAYFTNFGQNYSTTGGAGVTVTAGAGGATFSFTLSGAPAYPGSSTYFDQRQVFGGSTVAPESLFLSTTGDYLNFNTSPISEASDAISEDISTSEVNRVTGFMVVAYGLLVFTTGGIYLMSGGQPGAAVTPSSITNNAQASNGAADLQPIRINYSVLYLQAKGNIVRDASFAWQRQSYVGQDISTPSNHLFFNRQITEWCWCEEPFKQVYAVTDDGLMLSLAYVPDQEVTGWTHNTTQGLYASVCSIPEGNYHVVYMIVQRYLPSYAGGGWVYTLERMDTRTFKYVEDAWFLDCALQSPLYTAETFGGSGPGVVIPSGTSGVVTLTAVGAAATANVFSSAAVGDIFWAQGGKAEIVTLLSGSQVTAQVIEPFPTLPGTLTPLPLQGWEYGPALTTFVGLDMFDGLEVSILADGQPQVPQTVTNGTVTIPFPASKVLIGLPYTASGQTLQVDVDDRSGSIQGRRKQIPATLFRIFETVGLEVGIDFNNLTPLTDYDSSIPYSVPLQPYSGDIRVPVLTDWNTFGQVCFQQTNPLPATVLGINLEVEVGDTT